MLKTETNSQTFPEHNHPIESNVKIDPVAVGDTLKTTGKGVITSVKSMYAKAKEFRQKRQEEKMRNEENSHKEENGFFDEVTRIKEVLKKEPGLKTIEDIKKPELAPYPIVAPKTVEAIQGEEQENVDEEIKVIKEIVEPDVEVPKEAPQHSKDPYLLPSPQQKPTSKTPIEAKTSSASAKAKKPSWLRRQCAELWTTTKRCAKEGYTKVKESDMAMQTLLLSASGVCSCQQWW